MASRSPARRRASPSGPPPLSPRWTKRPWAGWWPLLRPLRHHWRAVGDGGVPLAWSPNSILGLDPSFVVGGHAGSHAGQDVGDSGVDVLLVVEVGQDDLGGMEIDEGTFHRRAGPGVDQQVPPGEPDRRLAILFHARGPAGGGEMPVRGRLDIAGRRGVLAGLVTEPVALVVEVVGFGDRRTPASASDEAGACEAGVCAAGICAAGGCARPSWLPLLPTATPPINQLGACTSAWLCRPAPPPRDLHHRVADHRSGRRPVTVGH